MTSTQILAAVVTVIGIIGTFLGIYFTVRGTTKTKLTEIRANSEAAAQKASSDAAADRQTTIDQIQENLNAAWTESRELRTELANARKMMSTIQDEAAEKQLTIRRNAEEEMIKMHMSYQRQRDADQRYISILIDHINERRDPPAPLRPQSEF